MGTYIKLQNVLLPRAGICAEAGLFYRSPQAGQLELDDAEGLLYFRREHTVCDFSSYFNALSLAKWKKYTQISQPRLCLILRGSFELQLLAYQASGQQHDGTPDAAVLRCHSIQGDGQTVLSFSFDHDASCAFLSFRLSALSKDAVFCRAWYEAKVEEAALHEVRLAANICTFKREPYITRNLVTLRREILNNPSSELYGRLQVFVSDNGQTLPLEQLADESVHIVYNKNVGGVGGFTRGLLEICRHHDTFDATHVIMMDDDIVIETEALFRTYMLLRCRRPEYEDLFVGGAMLRLDRPQIQHESGALWNVGHLRPLKHDLDLSRFENCIANEVDEGAEYNAWWYCCIPMQIVREDNLPSPFFIHCDDAEYGIRNTRNLALINGICVWHEPFDAKYSSFLSYYDMRNMLYANAFCRPQYGKGSCLRTLYCYVIADLFRYRYQDVRLELRAVRDFNKGADFLLHTDGEKLHKEIIAAGHKLLPEAELPVPADREDYARSISETESHVHKFLRRLSFNGYLLPVRRGGSVRCVPIAHPRPLNCYRCRTVIHYDAGSGKGFVTQKNYAELFRCLGQLIAVTFETLFRYDAAKKELRDKMPIFRSTGFWTAYLGL